MGPLFMSSYFIINLGKQSFSYQSITLWKAMDYKFIETNEGGSLCLFVSFYG